MRPPSWFSLHLGSQVIKERRKMGGFKSCGIPKLQDFPLGKQIRNFPLTVLKEKLINKHMAVEQED